MQQAKSFVKKYAPKAMKYYNNNVEPVVQKYGKPATHKVLDPVWNHPVT